jgi:hypothetical protein
MSAIQSSAKAGSSPEIIRRQCAQQMMSAFQQQAAGKTTQAFRTFQDAYQFGLRNGESVEKLTALSHLFGWYQKNGQDCGVIRTSQQGAKECGTSSQNKPSFQLEPKQERMVANFLFGAGEIIGGVFCIALPGGNILGAPVGVGLVLDGARTIYCSVCDMKQDSRERMEQLKRIEREAISAVSK